jgi:hypothetical protein
MENVFTLTALSPNILGSSRALLNISLVYHEGSQEGYSFFFF